MLVPLGGKIINKKFVWIKKIKKISREVEYPIEVCLTSIFNFLPIKKILKVFHQLYFGKEAAYRIFFISPLCLSGHLSISGRIYGIPRQSLEEFFRLKISSFSFYFSKFNSCEFNLQSDQI